MTAARFEKLAVTGVGACASVGLNAEQCSASVRAGINRFAEHPYYLALDKSGANWDEAMPPSVAMLPTLDPQLSSPDRLIQLLITAFQDLIASRQVERAMLEKAGFFLALPPDDTGTASLNLDESLVREFEHRTALDPFAVTKISRAGNTGMAELIHQAAEHLARGELERCIIAGVDSYFVGNRLQVLDEAWRLKSLRNIGGFIPGEGASAIMIEPVRSAEAQGLTALLRIEGLGIDAEPNPIRSERASSGQGLGEAILDAVQTGGERLSCDWVIGDLNGEAYKSFEWGTVSVRLHSLFSNLSAFWHPADCVGDIGAATPGLHVAQVAAAFGAGHAPANEALVLSTSDDGQRAALLLSGELN